LFQSAGRIAPKETTSQSKKLISLREAYQQEEVRNIGRFEEIIGQSEELTQVLWKVEQVAPTDSVVLITGDLWHLEAHRMNLR
jgi:transcriptional regulator with GAF, ATPase, and Fis domain